MKQFSLVVTLVWIVMSGHAFAGAWNVGKGTVYAQASFFLSRTRNTFNSSGERVPFLFDGRSRISGANLEISYGLTDRLMIYTSVPYISYNLGDTRIREQGSGLGDIYGSLQANILQSPVALSVEGGVKFPTASTADPTRVLVGEGQYDFDLIGKLGYFWQPASVYWNLEGGYRFRTRNRERDFKPGNEVLYRMETGYVASESLILSLLFSGFSGQRVETLGISPMNSERSLVNVAPSLTYRVTSQWGVRVEYGIPLDGQNFYAGRVLSLGVFFSNDRNSNNTIPKVNLPSVRGVSCCTTQ